MRYAKKSRHRGRSRGHKSFSRHGRHRGGRTRVSRGYTASRGGIRM